MGTLRAPPVTILTAGHRIGKHTTGYVTYRTGQWNLGPWGRSDVDVRQYQLGGSSAAIGLQNRQPNGHGYTVELQAGLSESHLVTEYVHRVRDGAKLRFGMTLSTKIGLSATLGADARVSEHTKLGASVECALAGGVTLSVR
jgi:DnaJ family protein C protein 11